MSLWRWAPPFPATKPIRVAISILQRCSKLATRSQLQLKEFAVCLQGLLEQVRFCRKLIFVEWFHIRTGKRLAVLVIVRQCASGDWFIYRRVKFSVGFPLNQPIDCTAWFPARAIRLRRGQRHWSSPGQTTRNMPTPQFSHADLMWDTGHVTRA